MKFYLKKKWYINKYTLQHIPIATEETPNHTALHAKRCIFQKNTIQHFQFFIQPSSNSSIISFFIFFTLYVNTLYICSISTSNYLSVNTKYEKHMIMYSIFLSLIALPSLVITLTSFNFQILRRLTFFFFAVCKKNPQQHTKKTKTGVHESVNAPGNFRSFLKN